MKSKRHSQCIIVICHKYPKQASSFTCAPRTVTTTQAIAATTASQIGCHQAHTKTHTPIFSHSLQSRSGAGVSKGIPLLRITLDTASKRFACRRTQQVDSRRLSCFVSKNVCVHTYYNIYFVSSFVGSFSSLFSSVYSASDCWQRNEPPYDTNNVRTQKSVCIEITTTKTCSHNHACTSEARRACTLLFVC